MARTVGNLVRGLLLTTGLMSSAVVGQDAAPSASDGSSAPVAAAASDISAPDEMSPPTLATIVEHLSTKGRKKFAELLEADWKKRPDWADMLLVLLKGESMGPGTGWFKSSEKRYGWNWLAERFDANSDGKITPEELGVKDPESDPFFARLDRDSDGSLRELDFDHFTRQPSTPASMLSQYLSGLCDTDSNGRITPEELTAFLKRADADKTGFITSEDMFREFTRLIADRDSGGNDMPRPERMIPMFFNGELGALESGPELLDVAPDFTLPTHDGSANVTLSKSRGKPVILIFGSFT